MEHTSHSLVSLFTVVSIAFLVPLLLHQFKIKALPVVVAEIAAGLMIGNSGFGLVREDAWLELLSLLGFIYLMFLSGLEMDFEAFRKPSGRKKGSIRPFPASVFIFAGIIALSYGLSLLLEEMGLMEDPFLMMLVISSISLGVVVPVLKEKKLMDNALGQTLLLITVLSDFVTMILLAVYVSHKSGNIGSMLLLILFFTLVIGSYLLIRRYSSRNVFKILAEGTSQFLTRGVFTLILLFVVLSESMGVESILGAFLAGMIISLLSPKKSFVHQLESFGYGFLIPIFFIMIGVRMEIWSLFTEFKVFLLIPLLLLCFFLAKMVPMLLLRLWYPWKQVAASGILLSASLSLVIAASTIALEMEIIDDTMNGALILVAVLSCLIFPILFNQLSPAAEEKKRSVSIIGKNQITIPVVHSLKQDGFEVKPYSSNNENSIHSIDPENTYKWEGIPALTSQALTRIGAFQADIIVFGTNDDETNIKLAAEAKKNGLSRIIVRVEDPVKMERMSNDGYAVFSTLYSARTLLHSLIENPSAIRFMMQDGMTLKEIRVNNPAYHEAVLRSLSFLGDALILRIYRDDSSVIPHGNTQLQLDDRLLVSGSLESIAALRSKLE